MDISEYKQAQSALRDKEVCIESLMERMQEGLNCITQDGRIKTINPAAEAIFGYPDGDLTGIPVNRLLPSILFPSLQDGNLGKTLTVEVLGRHSDDRELSLQLRTTPMRLENRFYYSLIVNSH